MRIPLYADLTEEEKLSLGLLLDSPAGQPIYELISGLLERYQAQVGRVGLRDKDLTRDWLIGFLDCAERIGEDLKLLVTEARRIAEEHKGRGEMVMGRLSSAPVASDVDSDVLT